MFQIEVIHTIRFGATPSGVTPADLTALENRVMTTLMDKVAEVQASLTAALARVSEDVNYLQATNADTLAKLAALQKRVDDGDAEAIAAMDSIKSTLDGVNPLPDFPPAPVEPEPLPPVEPQA